MKHFDVLLRYVISLVGNEEFTRSLTEKLLSYATGRKMTFTDGPVVDSILAEMDRSDGGLRDLIQQVVASDSFRQN
jgi:hypothetical protein